MSRRYLLVSHIPFIRKGEQIYLDQLWSNDLAELTATVGPIRLAAPELFSSDSHSTWGPQLVPLSDTLPVTFVGLPSMHHSWELWKDWKMRAILKKEVQRADLIHSSNLFPPYLGLLYAHFYAASLHKKTLFVIAEDYHDSLLWEWVRLSKNSFQHLRRSLVVRHIDRLTQKAAQLASLTLLFTPAAVERFRLYCTNGLAARDTTHTDKDIIAQELFDKKCEYALAGAPIRLVMACRHKPLKGVEFAVRAIAQLKKRGLYTEAYLYGHGPLTQELVELAAYLDVADRVHFPGSLAANQEVYEAFAANHISLMPHRTFEFARSLYDSFTGGTPVIAFHTPASQGAVREGVDGLLVPLDNVVALAGAIERLHNNRALLVELSTNARNRAFSETRTIWHAFRAELIQELFERN